MDSDLKANEDVLIEGTVDISEDNCNQLPEESNITGEDVVMNCDANEIPKIEVLAESDQQNGPLIDLLSGDIKSNPNPEIEIKSEEQKPADNLLGNEEVLANDVMNLDVNEEIINNTNEELTQESEQVIESQNSSANDSHKLSNDENITSDNIEIKNDSISDLPNEDIDVNNESNGPTISFSADEDMSDSDLRIAGLKTSLMLSEEKNKELEEELKKVYQHLFKCLDEKKNLVLKCETLEEQLDKIMATSAQKRPAQESPGALAKSTPPKKAPNNEMNSNNNQKNKKSVRFQEQRPYFGRFGARFRDNDMTPPPFPGPFAPAFIPPPTQTPSRVPIGTFRAPPFMTSPEMTDLVLTDAFQLISNIGNRLHLTATIVDRAIRLFRQCYESPLRAMCRTQNQSTASACVYIACREEHCPQSIKTLCSVSKIDIKVMNQCCKYIVNTLGLCLDQITPEDAVMEFCGRSGFSSVIQRAANQIAWKALQMNLLPHKSPQTAAAAAVFLASMASEDQRPVFEMSQLTGIGDITIRNAYNRMLPYARQLFPPNFPFFLLPEQMPRL